MSAEVSRKTTIITTTENKWTKIGIRIAFNRQSRVENSSKLQCRLCANAIAVLHNVPRIRRCAREYRRADEINPFRVFPSTAGRWCRVKNLSNFPNYVRDNTETCNSDERPRCTYGTHSGQRCPPRNRNRNAFLRRLLRFTFPLCRLGRCTQRSCRSLF